MSSVFYKRVVFAGDNILMSSVFYKRVVFAGDNILMSSVFYKRVVFAGDNILMSSVFCKCVVFAGDKTPMSSVFCQALQQLSTIPSRQLCVRLAAGGDPTYAFNVRLTGEEVHGTSRSLLQCHHPSRAGYFSQWGVVLHSNMVWYFIQ